MPVDSLMPKKSKSSGGGFIIAAIVMLLLMGGLIYWKTRQDAEPLVVAVPSAPVETQKLPDLEAPPPPPPPVEELDAGKEPKVDRTAKRSAVGGCDNCNGTENPQLRSALAARGGQARGCYERVLRNNAGVEGRLLVNVTIGAQGQVCSARVTDQGLGDAAVANCVQRMFQSATFPPPSGGCVYAAVPLNFVQKK